MACERFLDGVADAAAGALPGSDLEAHLEECEECRTDLWARREVLSQMDTELRGLLAIEPSPALQVRIREAVAGDAPAAAGWLRRPVWWAWAAAPLLLAVGLLATWDESRERGALPFAADVSEPAPPEASPSFAAPRVLERRPARPAPLETITRPVPGGPRLAAASKPDPKVLVPPGQVEALTRFAAELEGRTVEPDSLLVADPAAPVMAPRPIDVVAIEIVALDSSDPSGL